MNVDARSAAFTPQVGLFRRRPTGTEKWWTPVVSLDTEIHSAHNIAMTACGLGIAIGAGTCAVVWHGWTSSGILALYLALIPAYHMLEYLCVAMYNPSRVSMESFMFNPDEGNNYHKAMAVSAAEYAIECWLFPQTKSPGMLTFAGLLIALAGQFTRTLAMVTAKSSFNHYIASHRASDHQLITHGIYRYERHPSYVGFFLWAVGLQLMLKNPLSLLAFTLVLGFFFVTRTRYEEKTLCRMFGSQYASYRSKTPSLVPFIGHLPATSTGSSSDDSDDE
ncbi:farnesyl cysteine-carboxyl methyltransferase [Dipsacomyces acuminosporus]|nr:farnesyl cysteine-carboxyl methyltransferase [Dipsacomyces acuminosporus]